MSSSDRDTDEAIPKKG